MPLKVSTCGVLMMRVIGSTGTHQSVTVRRDIVRQLILFHQQSQTPRYPQRIDDKYLSTLPENGVPKDLKVYYCVVDVVSHLNTSTPPTLSVSPKSP